MPAAPSGALLGAGLQEAAVTALEHFASSCKPKNFSYGQIKQLHASASACEQTFHGGHVLLMCSQAEAKLRSTNYAWRRTAAVWNKIEAHLKCKVKSAASALDRRCMCRANSLAWLTFSPRPLGTPELELPSCCSNRSMDKGRFTSGSDLLEKQPLRPRFLA